jgi:hypothetical protein
MAISLLHDELETECEGNIFSDGYNKYHCKNCYNIIKNFSHFACQTNVFTDPRNLIKFSHKINHREGAFTSALCELIKNYKYCENDADQVLNDTDPIKRNQTVIGAIKEALRGQLTSIASKLLSSEHTKLEDLSVEEQHLWNLFDNSDIYKFITGEPDTLTEFQFNYIEPCQLAAHLPPGTVLGEAAPQAQPPPPAEPPISAQPPTPAPLPAQAQPQAPVLPIPPAAPPLPGPSGAQLPPHSHDLRPRQPLDYKELNSGIKQRCRKLRCQAKAVMTKLSPGAFSPKPPPDTHHPDHQAPGPSS